jgi:hypothetical protein
MRGFLFKIITFTETIANREETAELPLQSKKASYNHVDLPPLISVDVTRVCIPIGNKEILLAAVYKSPGSTWSDADIAKLLNLRHKYIWQMI